MGCVSSKFGRRESEREIICDVNGECLPNHVVSLTSSTYGALKLDNSDAPKSGKKEKDSDDEDEGKKKSPMRKEKTENDDEEEQEQEEEEEETEVINYWELIGDLEEETTAASIRGKNSPNSHSRSPFKRINKVRSPMSGKKSTAGKENRKIQHNVAPYSTPKRVSTKSDLRCQLSPLFDPYLVEAYEKELREERELIMKIFSDNLVSKCPPGGEESVVLYTTTLRGIRRTFEACNTVRSILQTHDIQMYERDVSMDEGFKEQLRNLMGSGARVPLVFVKGRLVGGAEELTRLEEEGKLGNLLEGVPRGLGCVCEGCAGIRFVMCSQCCGSRKVLKEDGSNDTIRCGECNENGLIHCPLCS